LRNRRSVDQCGAFVFTTTPAAHAAAKISVGIFGILKPKAANRVRRESQAGIYVFELEVWQLIDYLLPA
jgi:hypothetical protein